MAAKKSKVGYVGVGVTACLFLSGLGLTGAVGSPKPASTADSPVRFRPGSPGLGDPYFPLEGNGG